MLSKGARPTLIGVVFAAAVVGGVGGFIITRPDDSTVFIRNDAPVIVDAPADSPPVDTPPDTPPIDALGSWTMQTIHGPEATVALDGADGTDIATIGGAMTIVSPWEQSSQVTVSTRSIGVGVGTWSTISLATVTNVEDAKFCDVDGDGNLDVMAGGQGKRIRIWFGPTPFSTSIEIDAATNIELWMQLGCTTPTSKTFTADGTTDVITATAHGWSTQDIIRTSNSGGGLPGGLATSTDYYWIRTGANTGKLATTRANAIAGTAIDITSAGTGTHTAAGGMRVWAGGRGDTALSAVTADASTDTLTKAAHAAGTGDPFRIANSGGALPGGLAANTTYYAISTGTNTFKAATSPTNAYAGTAIDLTSAGSGTQTVTRLAFVAYFQSGAPRTSSAWSYQAVGVNGWLMGMQPGDFDGDGDVDVLITERQAGCCAGFKGSKWFRNDGGAVWTTKDIYSFTGGGPQPDGRFFALVGSNTVVTCGASATCGPGSTQCNRLIKSVTADNWVTWTNTIVADSNGSPVYPSNTGQCQAMAVCDITGDGTDDYVITHSASTGTLDGVVMLDGATAAVTSIDLGTGEKYDTIDCRDMDGDGDLDVVTTEQNAGLGSIWFRNPRLP